MKIFIILSCCLILFSCALFPPSGKETEDLSKDEEALITKIRTLLFEGDINGAIESGRRYLLRYADSENAGKVRVYVGRANLKLGHTDRAIEVLSPIFKEDHPDRLKIKAYLITAEAQMAKGKISNATENILKASILDISESQLYKAKELLSEEEKMLTLADLENMAEKYNSSPLLFFMLERSLKLSERGADKDYKDRIVELISRYTGADLPENKGLERGIRKRELSPFRIGVICPLTGRFSKLGESFANGAILALKEARKRGVRGVEIVVGDTKANSLEAYLVAERLIKEEDVDVIIGAISSSSTVAAAQVAQARKRILFSPVAPERGIDDIGDYIFQDLRNYESEIIAVAKVACRELGIKRIALLASDNQLNRRIELLLRAEVEREGGNICLADYYKEGDTDFKENIDRIRAASPEALFIPSDKDDLVLILPQLSFYEFGVQLLGLSSWDFDDLIRMTGKDMTGALFPAKTSTNDERELYNSAAAYTGQSEEAANRFEIKGYAGAKKIIDLLTVEIEDMNLREKMEYLLNNRKHQYLKSISDKGILFYTVRNAEKVPFLSHKSNQADKNREH
ncbi:MAG: ABC transporter substrate-binding protein [Candidatus Krumholzibacteriota bacterium]|nr:ABC transporter substrate-binding protein [Candidatus Krumholzibacteriota bacterium]